MPNLRQIGPSRFWYPMLIGNGNLYFLARPFDPADLPRPWRDGRGNAYIRVPTDLMVDIASLANFWPESDAEKPPCVPMHHPAIDRFPGALREIGFEADPEASTFISKQRAVLRHEDGIPILRDTNASAADFFLMEVTPGELPEGVR